MTAGAHNPSDILTVQELVSRIRGRLEETFSALWVTGEISNLKTPYSGHTYFTLKDEHSQIPAVFFKFKKRYVRFEPEDGMQVLCKGAVTVYEVRGTVQLSVDYMEPVGLGALHLAYEQNKARLEKEGLFDTVHKKEIPAVPQRIGVITSATGAAIQDILNIISRRFANVEILIAPVHVQGDLAAPEIIEALKTLNRHERLDVIILARGGGSLEDLWPFNEESVARAIFASQIPVISAVGHETDFTIADFVADFRAPTPSAAAELVVRNKADIEEKLETLGTRLQHRMRHFMDRKHAEVEILSRRLVSPEQKIGMVQQRVDDLRETLSNRVWYRTHALHERLQRMMVSLRLLSPRVQSDRLRERLKGAGKKIEREMAVAIQARRDQLTTHLARLNALSPLNVLQRGYSIVYTLPEQKIVREIGLLALHDRLKIRFHHGQAECIVEKIDEG